MNIFLRGMAIPKEDDIERESGRIKIESQTEMDKVLRVLI